MNKLRQLDQGLARGEATLTALVLLAMIFVAAAQALLRNFSDMGVSWANGALHSIEWADQFLMKGTLWLAFLGASLATHDEKHIGIDILPRLAPPKIRAAMRGIVGVTVGVICFYYARVVMRTILNNAQEVPFDYEVLLDAGPAHICTAPAASFSGELSRPDLFCSIRGALEGIGVPVATPEAVLELIVPAMFFLMAIRFVIMGIASFASIPLAASRIRTRSQREKLRRRRVMPPSNRTRVKGRRPEMEFWIFVFLLGLALLGAPLFAIFGAAAMLLFSDLANTPITGATNDVFSEKFANSPLLVTIPLFTFAGYLMAESGTPQRLVKMSRAWLGWLPGGLAIVCLMASAFFTTFTGGSGITIVAIGGLLYPALMADRYPENFSLGLVTSGGSLGLLFPPSLPIIIYGVVAGQQIEYLFMAGVIPGILTLIAIGVYAVYVGKANKMPRTAFVRADAAASLWEAKWEVLLPLVLIGGMLTGSLRIHEAAAFTALYVLVIEVWVYRDVSFRGDLPRIIRESMTLVGAILAILATAVGFTSFLIQARVPFLILDAMSELITSQLAFLLVLNVFLIVVGMLMDIFSAIVVVVPLIVPIAARFGVDPIHLGIVFLLNLEIGYMTPPVGLNLFIASFRFEKPVTVLYRAVLPFIGLLGVALLFTTYGENLSLWLPEMRGYERATAPAQVEAPASPAEDTPPPATGGGLDALEDELDSPSGGGGGLDALEAELDADESGGGGGGGLDALEEELGLDDEDSGGSGGGGLDALEEELGLDDEPLEDELDDEGLDDL